MKRRILVPPEEQLRLLRRRAARIVPEEELLAKLRRSWERDEPLRVKLGIDPTAPDIHLGFAVVLWKLRQFQDLGHHVILILGDFTARIGDPSGQDKTRPPLPLEVIQANARTYREQMSLILNPERMEVRRNGEWLDPLRFDDIIRLAAKLTVPRILERDDFQRRLQEGRELRLHEILYPLCQAYDSVAIGADVEMGGLDQTFNILLGRDLQREFGQEPQVGFFMPLLVGTDGREKMSKSLGNYIGITEPPEEMYAKVMSIPDEVMRDYFLLCTSLPEEEVEEVLRGHPKRAKMRLAREIVSLYHSPQAAQEAEATFERVHRERELPEEVPEVFLSRSELEDGRIAPHRLLALLGLVSSNSEGRRKILEGGAYIQGQRIPSLEPVAVEEGMVVHVGRRKFARVRLKD